MPNTIIEIRNQLTVELLPVYGESEAGQMIKMLFEHFCGISGASMVLRKNEYLSQEQYSKLIEAISALKVHVPIQYVIGSAWFADLRFEVNPSVLIPRPETEELVDCIVKDYGHSLADVAFKVLDIGTGSGCIAVALKKSMPGWVVSACDFSAEALLVALRNAEMAGTGIDFFKTDILHWKEWPDAGSYNLIVSNPPYVCEHEKEQMQPNVLEHEPPTALYVPDEDPLVFYRAIAEFASSRLVKNGKLYLEINENYGQEIIHLLGSSGFADAELRKDFKGKDRFAIACKV